MNKCICFPKRWENMAKSKTKLKKKIGRYVRGYAKRNNMTEEQALEQDIVQNVIAWINLREGKKREQKRK